MKLIVIMKIKVFLKFEFPVTQELLKLINIKYLEHQCLERGWLNEYQNAKVSTYLSNYLQG